MVTCHGQATVLLGAAENAARMAPAGGERPSAAEVRSLVEEASQLPFQAELLAELTDVLSFAGNLEAQARRCVPHAGV